MLLSLQDENSVLKKDNELDMIMLSRSRSSAQSLMSEGDCATKEICIYSQDGHFVVKTRNNTTRQPSLHDSSFFDKE